MPCLLPAFLPAQLLDFCLPGFTLVLLTTKCHRHKLPAIRVVWYFQQIKPLMAALATLLESTSSSAKQGGCRHRDRTDRQQRRREKLKMKAHKLPALAMCCCHCGQPCPSSPLLSLLCQDGAPSLQKIPLSAGKTCLYFALRFQRDKRLPPHPTPGFSSPRIRALALSQITLSELRPWQSRQGRHPCKGAQATL